MNGNGTADRHQIQNATRKFNVNKRAGTQAVYRPVLLPVPSFLLYMITMAYQKLDSLCSEVNIKRLKTIC